MGSTHRDNLWSKLLFVMLIAYTTILYIKETQLISEGTSASLGVDLPSHVWMGTRVDASTHAKGMGYPQI